jgi:hypothetical protein
MTWKALQANEILSVNSMKSANTIVSILRTLQVLIVFISVGPLYAADREPLPGELDFFESRIRPILVNHCYKCHSESSKQAKGGLRLDSRESVIKGGDSGPAVVPGHVNESLIIQAVAYDGGFYDMPPSGKLSEIQISDLKKWVQSGAADPRKSVGDTQMTGSKSSSTAAKNHWAFQKVKTPEIPKVIQNQWPLDAIDHFILAKLEEKQLKPAPVAQRQAWLRRVWFDLVGLPPTSDAIARFMNDKSSELQARTKVVDELLAQPQFGERWGRHWLDVARFAESSGGGRTLLFKDAWRYRDYVINAFNADMPYNQFLKEQIAGDILPSKTESDKIRQLTATGFLVLGPTNYEEQDKYQLRMDIVDEQIDTIGRTTMGMTIGCARCHDHKFDPIPTRDYYAIAGIFRSTRTLQNDTDNVAHWIDQPLPPDSITKQAIANHEKSVNELQSKIKSIRSQILKLDSRTSQLASAGVINPDILPGVVIDDAKAKPSGNWKSSIYGGNYLGVGAVYDTKNQDRPATLTFDPDFPKSGLYEVRLAYVPHSNRATNTAIRILHADGEELKHVNQQAKPPIEGRFLSLGTFRFEAGGAGFVMVSNEGSNGTVSVDAVWFVPPEETSISHQNIAKNDQGTALLKELRSQLSTLEKQLVRLKKQAPERPFAMTVRDHENAQDSPIHIRGNSKTLGPKVPRGGLSVVTEVPFETIKPETSSGRPGFAEWLTDNRHPLTARVMVNRVWLWTFGDGLVRTADNFGTTGQLPTHPELLDHLASRFMENGWSVKHLIRDIVLSQTYAMSDDMSDDAELKDPENQLLSRFSRRRLDAESLRDAMLAAAGVIDQQVGGPNIQGATSIDSNDNGAAAVEYGYQFKDFRRSAYTPAFRNKRLELFEAFDFADINQAIGRREQSTVATQALFLMNHPFVREMAHRTAKRLLLSPFDDNRGRLDQITRWILSRPATEAEADILLPSLKSASSQTDLEKAWTNIAHALFASVEFRYTH